MSEIQELEDKVKVLLDEIETLKREKKNETFEYPFAANENYFTISINGNVTSSMWTKHNFDTTRYSQGNAFKTPQEAERERDKRALLTRFRQFRDKCNGDWKPGTYDCKYFISYDGSKNVLESGWNDVWDNFNTFGYFYDERDCLRAIDLFGDEIKRLWVDE
nr:MAG TPA: hypothetical protein [Caudoviricetes sp.]